MAAYSKKARLDYTAICLSGLCVLHCTALPLLAAGVPWIGALGIVDDWFHQLMLLIVVPLSVLALAWGWRQARSLLPPALGAMGLAVMSFAAFEMHPVVTGNVERDLTLLGAGILTLAHGINLRNWWRGRVSHSKIAAPATPEGAES